MMPVREADMTNRPRLFPMKLVRSDSHRMRKVPVHIAEAWGDLCGRHMSMELSMLLAITAATVIGEWVSALVIALFVLAAEILEDLSMDRGRDALTRLMSFLPDIVHRLGSDGDQISFSETVTTFFVMIFLTVSFENR